MIVYWTTLGYGLSVTGFLNMCTCYYFIVKIYIQQNSRFFKDGNNYCSPTYILDLTPSCGLCNSITNKKCTNNQFFSPILDHRVFKDTKYFRLKPKGRKWCTSGKYQFDGMMQPKSPNHTQVGFICFKQTFGNSLLRDLSKSYRCWPG